MTCTEDTDPGSGKPQAEGTLSPLILGSLLAGMGLFGSTTPLSKIIGEAYPVFTASLLRMAIASLVLAPFVWTMTGRFKHATRSDIYVIFAISGVGMVGFTAAMLFGMRLATGVIGSTIMSATPAVTAAAAVVFLGAAMNWRKAGALSLSVLGVAVINLLGGSGETGGNAVYLGAALVGLAVCFEAVYTLLSRRLSDGVSSLEATFGASMIALVLFAILALVFDARPFDLSASNTGSVAALIFWGAAAGGLAPVLWYNGARNAPAALTASAMSVMPLSALFLSYALLGEPFRWLDLLGFGLVFAGLILMILEHAEPGQTRANSSRRETATRIVDRDRDF